MKKYNVLPFNPILRSLLFVISSFCTVTQLQSQSNPIIISRNGNYVESTFLFETINSMVLKGKILVILIMLGICLTGCKKEANRYLITDEFKEWTVFKIGSYWLYKNETSLKIDSSYVTTVPVSNLPNLENTPSDEVFFEIMNYSLQGPFFGTFQIDSRSACVYVINSTKFYYVPVLVYFYSTGFEMVEFIPDIKINDINFKNVIHTRHYDYRSISTDSVPLNDTVTIDSYFVKNVGIIKYIQKIGKSDTTWTLLRYHCIQ